MANVNLRGVRKKFGTVSVVDGVSIDVEDGEFIALLGPSGCGKTTLLRLIAGLERSDAGEISIGGNIVSSASDHVDPEDRNLGMMFQSYALWPTMSVAGNVGFALKAAGLTREDRDRRVNAALEKVGMTAFAMRRPSQLSGGQRQRTALARCLALEPRLLLLDEPLANLDAHLRHEMQTEFRRIHRETGSTFIFVTHDQNEAMALAQRIAVMDKGRLQQVGTPEELYTRPQTEMVARFLGGGMVVPGTVTQSHNGAARARLAGYDFSARGDAAPGPAQICLRPETIEIGNTSRSGVRARVVDIVYRGGNYQHKLVPEGVGATMFDANSTTPFPPGSDVSLHIQDAWIVPGAAS
ncbi:ABC transporter ATP-binding protein [Pelagibacterium flavum]|uniref:ABC transporter ATP-binding protein n=1 Tax=Pelagibacterium flavum TaxID=2984530 RepID=A0ABY6IR96_9HYPH|nr:ABC transporter ATP-binding protein [Pelagibacterium sp. YIM 151497]UYQ73135.1 ABC transporter ATP-binding protein [Pelagibacterium sp. YIM 151497]|tara:strand:+ start:4304 stop:5362 length:1059 start_codon:yes stop_codon:yes gene_type:complete